MSILSQAHFHNEEAAIARLEAIVWPNGAHCPRCGGFDRITKVRGGRAGLWRCGPCKRQFTVTVGTVFERSHVPLHKWFQAAHLLASSKKGISAHQLHRTLKVTYKTAWFMEHRLREAMRSGALAPMGGGDKIVEADETYFGNKNVITKRTKRGKAALSSKRAIVALVERGGSARTFHVDRADQPTVGRIMNANIRRETEIHTDESGLYGHVQHYFDGHHSVTHSGNEYVRYEADRTVHTNTIEGYFSIFKRGMKGVYQHCAEKHLHRYLAEFDFRYNERAALGVTDEARADKLISGIVGKRLMYRDSYPVGVSV